ncbi:MAG: HEPN domain-containing protein [Deltaproteobacteria bacterium]|nr:HEPN domain-containing protein [Deltaproteobacteria bacterium]
MNEDVKDLRQKSIRSLNAAKKLHEEGHYDFSASRAYYALFYTAEALLLIQKKAFSKHSSVISAFYHAYVEHGPLEHKFHQLLNKAFEMRNDADYVGEMIITAPESAKLLSDSAEYISATEKFFAD